MTTTELDQELYFLISKFLAVGPCTEAAQVLRREIEANQLLPTRYDYLGNSHRQTWEEYESSHAWVPDHHLRDLCFRLFSLSRRKRSAGLISQVTLLGRGRNSVFADDDKLSHSWSQLEITALRHSAWPLASLNAHHQIPFERVLRARETGGVCPRRRLCTPSLFGTHFAQSTRILGHLSSVFCVIFDRTGRVVFTGADDKLVKAWDTENGRLLFTYRGCAGDITDLSVNHENNLLAAGSCDRLIRIWSIEDGSTVAVLFAHTAMINICQFIPFVHGDLRYLVSASNDGSICFWAFDVKSKIFEVKPVQYVERSRPGMQMTCLSYSPGGKFVVAGSTDKNVRVYKVQMIPAGPERILEEEAHDTRVECVVWAHYGMKFMSGSCDVVLLVWTLGRAGKWKRLKVNLDFLPDNKTLGKDTGKSGSGCGCMTSPQKQAQADAKLHLHVAQWSQDNSTVIVSLSDHTIRLINSENGTVRRILKGHLGFFYSMDTSPLQPNLLLTASHDGYIQLWDMATGQVVKKHFNSIDGQGHGSYFDCVFSPDYTRIAATDSHGHLTLLSMTDGKRYAEAPKEQFFHTDYRPFLLSGLNVVDEQTNMPIQKMSPPFLVDSDGLPYPPHIQRTVPGREHCSDNFLVPHTVTATSENDEVVIVDNVFPNQTLYRIGDETAGAVTAHQPSSNLPICAWTTRTIAPRLHKDNIKHDYLYRKAMGAFETEWYESQCRRPPSPARSRPRQPSTIDVLSDRLRNQLPRHHYRTRRNRNEQRERQARISRRSIDYAELAGRTTASSSSTAVEEPSVLPIPISLPSPTALDSMTAQQRIQYLVSQHPEIDRDDSDDSDWIEERVQNENSENRSVTTRRRCHNRAVDDSRVENVVVSDEAEEGQSSEDSDSSASESSSASRQSARESENISNKQISKRGVRIRRIDVDSSSLDGNDQDDVAELPSDDGGENEEDDDDDDDDDYHTDERARKIAKRSSKVDRKSKISDGRRRARDSSRNAVKLSRSKRRRRKPQRFEESRMEVKPGSAKINEHRRKPESDRRRRVRVAVSDSEREEESTPGRRNKSIISAEIEEGDESMSQLSKEDLFTAKRLPKTFEEVPERLHFSKWITDDMPRRSPLFPQIGDEVVYFWQGHELYVDAVLRQNLYVLQRPYNGFPWERLNLKTEEPCLITGVKWLLHPWRMAEIKLARRYQNNARYDKNKTFLVRYHDMPGVIDFIVLLQHYEAGLGHRWSVKDEIASLIDEHWYFGQIQKVSPMDQEFPESQFQNLEILWDNGEKEHMSAWDLDTVKGKKRPTKRGSGVKAVHTELIKWGRYLPNDDEWFINGWIGETDRLLKGFRQMMVQSLAEQFNTPVDVHRYPDYMLVIEYPICLSTILQRVCNVFYRRQSAVVEDVRSIYRNAQRYNARESPIVRSAKMLSQILIKFINDPDESDIMPILRKVKMENSVAKPTTGVLGLEFETWEESCQYILGEIMESRDSAPFRATLSDENPPAFLEDVDDPIDLEVIGHNLENGVYSEPREFQLDVCRMLNLAKKYSRPRDKIYLFAHRLEDQFRSIVEIVKHQWPKLKANSKITRRVTVLNSKDDRLRPPRPQIRPTPVFMDSARRRRLGDTIELRRSGRNSGLSNHSSDEQLRKSRRHVPRQKYKDHDSSDEQDDDDARNQPSTSAMIPARRSTASSAQMRGRTVNEGFSLVNPSLDSQRKRNKLASCGAVNVRELDAPNRDSSRRGDTDAGVLPSRRTSTIKREVSETGSSQSEPHLDCEPKIESEEEVPEASIVELSEQPIDLGFKNDLVVTNPASGSISNYFDSGALEIGGSNSRDSCTVDNVEVCGSVNDYPMDILISQQEVVGSGKVARKAGTKRKLDNLEVGLELTSGNGVEVKQEAIEELDDHEELIAAPRGTKKRRKIFSSDEGCANEDSTDTVVNYRAKKARHGKAVIRGKRGENSESSAESDRDDGDADVRVGSSKKGNYNAKSDDESSTNSQPGTSRNDGRRNTSRRQSSCSNRSSRNKSMRLKGNYENGDLSGTDEEEDEEVSEDSGEDYELSFEEEWNRRSPKKSAITRSRKKGGDLKMDGHGKQIVRSGRGSGSTSRDSERLAGRLGRTVSLRDGKRLVNYKDVGESDEDEESGSSSSAVPGEFPKAVTMTSSRGRVRRVRKFL